VRLTDTGIRLFSALRTPCTRAPPLRLATGIEPSEIPENGELLLITPQPERRPDFAQNVSGSVPLLHFAAPAFLTCQLEI
jgi:hypothetical protein